MSVSRVFYTNFIIVFISEINRLQRFLESTLVSKTDSEIAEILSYKYSLCVPLEFGLKTEISNN